MNINMTLKICWPHYVMQAAVIQNKRRGDFWENFILSWYNLIQDVFPVFLIVWWSTEIQVCFWSLCKRRRQQLKRDWWISISKSPSLVLLSQLLSCFIPIVSSPLISSLCGSTQLFIYIPDKALKSWMEGYIWSWISTVITNTRQDWENKNIPIEGQVKLNKKLVKYKQQNKNP